MKSTDAKWFVNGGEPHSLPLDDRGLAYGDGLFETMRVIGSEIPLLDLHRARLFSGCKKLDINLDEPRLNRQIDQALELVHAAQSVMKVMVTRGGQASGYARTENAEPNIYIRLSPLGSPDSSESNPLHPPQVQPLRAQICNTRLSIQPELAGIKHLNRLEQVLAANEIKHPAEEGILMDTEGYIVEAISSNLILIKDGLLHMPDLTNAGVRGVMQTCISQLVGQADIEGIEGIRAREVKTAKMTLDELCQSSEILLVNSVRGIRNISAIENIWQSCETGEMQFGIQLRQLLKEKLNNGFYSF